MHRKKQDVGIPHRRKLGQPLGQHPALAFRQGLDRGRREADRPAQQLPFGGLIEDAAREINDLDGVVAAAQRGDELGCAREGDGALRRRAAREHRDPHQRIPAS